MLRRAAQFHARRHFSGPVESSGVSPETMVQLAAAAGIPEEDVRRAIQDLSSEEAADPESPSRRLLGSSRLRAVRELDLSREDAREHLESLLKLDQGLKLRQRTDAGSLWDAGDTLGAARRTLDLSRERPLLKVHSLELQLEEPEEGRCSAELTADVSNQRGEYLSLAGVVGATIAVLFAIAGFQNPLFFLGVPPSLAAPGYGFRLAYQRSCTELRSALDTLLDAAEQGSKGEAREDRSNRPPEGIQDLKPIPKFAPNRDE